MPESDDPEKLIAEVAEIDSQMEALSVRKRQCLSKFPKGYTRKIRLGGIFNDHNGRSGVEIALRGAESNDELTEVLAEAVVYLGERGLLPLKNEQIPELPENAAKVVSPNKKMPNNRKIGS